MHDGLDSRRGRAYALARRAELVAAMAEAGVANYNLFSLDVADQDAAAQLVGSCRSIAELLRRHEPAVVFTHAYEGGHPDHDAVAFATHIAVRMTQACGAPSPIIVEMPLYRGEQGRMAVQSFRARLGYSRCVSRALSRRAATKAEDVGALCYAARDADAVSCRCRAIPTRAGVRFHDAAERAANSTMNVFPGVATGRAGWHLFGPPS
jgi:N-acetylglucosamine malate deacetylase 2